MSPTLHQAEPPRRADEDQSHNKECDRENDTTGIRTSAWSNGRRKRIETLEAREQEDPVADANQGDRSIHDAAHGPVSPPQYRIVQAHREDNHPRDDTETEHCDADEDPTQGRYPECDDQEVQEFVIAGKTVDDSDREHGLVFPVLRQMAMEPGVEVPMLHQAVPMLVHMEHIELPQESNHPDYQEHDRDEKVEMRRDAEENRRPQRIEEERDDRCGQHVTGRPAHAHQTSLADAPAPSDQGRHSNEVIGIVAVLEAQRKSQYHESNEFKDHEGASLGSTTATRVTSSAA